MVPNYPPAFLGSKQSDGPGWNLVLYCRLSQSVRALLDNGRSSELPAIDLLQRYMDPVHGASLRGQRLKCIFGLADKDSPFGLVMRQMLKSYNFTPFLSKTASLCYVGPATARQSYFEIDIDIHTWGIPALTGFNTVKEKLDKLLLRGGVVIEADADCEMPEQV